MSIKPFQKGKPKFSDDKTVEDKNDSEKSKELTDPPNEASCHVKNRDIKISPSSLNDNRATSSQKSANDEVRIYRSIDGIPAFKFKGPPKSSRNFADRVQSKFKRSLTSYNARKSLTTIVKKPKLDVCVENENRLPIKTLDILACCSNNLTHKEPHGSNHFTDFEKCSMNETEVISGLNVSNNIISDFACINNETNDLTSGSDDTSNEMIDQSEENFTNDIEVPNSGDIITLNVSIEQNFGLTQENMQYEETTVLKESNFDSNQNMDSEETKLVNETTINDKPDESTIYDKPNESTIYDKPDKVTIDSEYEFLDNSEDLKSQPGNRNADLKIEPVGQGFKENQQNKIVAHTCLATKFKSTLKVNDWEGVLPVKDQLIESKSKSLINLLEHSPEGADMKLSLFISACAHDPRSLHPFPKNVFEDNDVGRYLLYYIAEEIPSVSMILYLLKDDESESMRKELLPVVDWLVRGEEPRLESVKKEEFNNILRLVSNVRKEEFPTKIFRIKNRRSSRIESSWKKVKQQLETKYAYHNCKVEEAHSILHYGLHNKLNENGVFGPGIYLTDNLVACKNSCNSGATWGKSSIASKVKIAFITEYVSHHSITAYSGDGIPFSKDPVSLKVSDKDGSFKYYYVKKPNLVRLRYLLVYTVCPSAIPKNPFSNMPMRKKIIKYLNIFRLSLLIATILMGATASKRSMQNPSHLVHSVQSYYQRFSTELVHWPIWKFLETPYIRFV